MAVITQTPTAPTGVRAVFAVPNYRRFVTGQSVSLIGSWTETIALALLVLDLTHSSLTLGFVMATRYLPVLVGTPYAGLIVDRHDKRHVLMMTNTVLGLTSLAIGAAVLTHTVAMWHIFASATVFGAMTCLALTLGCLFWVMGFHLTGAGWSVTVRRQFENVMSLTPIVVLCAALLTGVSLWLGLLGAAVVSEVNGHLHIAAECR